MKPSVETEFLLQWGSRKRLRCVRVRGNNPAQVSSSSNTSTLRRRFLTLSHKEAPSSQPTPRYTRNSEMATLRSEKEERYYSTRGLTVEENGKIMVDGKQGEDQNHHHRYENGNGINGGGKKWVWPKLCISLSSKEKEEDFMAMKGCKLPQRPKKRAKLIQRTLLLASPGAWLTDLSLERYEVREKKICKKQQKAKGLKGMGSDSIDCSDSE